MDYSFAAPAVLVEDSNGIHPLNSKSLLLKQRVIFLDDEINGDTVNEAIRQIILLAQESHKPITLMLDSSGGSIQAGFKLIDLMNACPCAIRTIALGCAASMGAVILAAGTKGHRFISPRSKVMLHEPQLGGYGVSGSTTQIESVANDLKTMRDTINQMLCEYTGKDTETMKKATSYDHYFTAEEALKFGLVDEIVSDAKLFTYISGGESHV